MGRNIVIFSDGTGNTANKNRGTNVFKLFEMVDLHDPEREQITFYDDGVGTAAFKPLALLGGAFGWGLSRNVRHLYASLARVYRPGDHLYLFGFSRGAFTVRTLAGLITRIGIIDAARAQNEAELHKRVREAWRAYRHDNHAWLERLWHFGRRRPDIDAFAREHCHDLTPDLPAAGRGHGKARIRFLGVWDTVSAVGFPVLWVADAINCLIYRYKFPNYRLSPCVERAAHALSLDDERKTFHPRLWDESREGELAGRIQQVWFAGVHSNVGGGYPKQGMSLVALEWMIRQAEAAAPDPAERLRLVAADRAWLRRHRNVHDKLYDSRAGLAVYYRYAPRDVHFLCRHIRRPCAFPPWKHWPNATTAAKIHASVVQRILLATDGYAPGNLPADMILVDTEHEACRWTNFVEDYRACLGPGENSLLDRARGLVRLRQAAGWAFMILSLLLIARSLPADLWQRGPLSIAGYFFGSEFVANLFQFRFAWLYAALAGTFALTLWLRLHIRQRWSEAWHRLRGEHLAGSPHPDPLPEGEGALRSGHDP